MNLLLLSIATLLSAGFVSGAVLSGGCQGQQCGKQAKSKIKRRPRSCLDHFKAGSKKCGVYAIYDGKGNSFPVYCDMKSEPGNAWTLIVSWSTKNRGLREFKTSSLTQNTPVNENEPNFDLYRLTLDRMKSIRSHSTHWRSTCSFPTRKLDYIKSDYVRGNLKDFDILTYHAQGKCQKVEYVNIRGHLRIHATLPWWQKVNTYFLHLDSSSGGCGFPKSGAVSSEDNFGFYGKINRNFQCTAKEKSTTQWWLGGHI